MFVALKYVTPKYVETYDTEPWTKRMQAYEKGRARAYDHRSTAWYKRLKKSKQPPDVIEYRPALLVNQHNSQSTQLQRQNDVFILASVDLLVIARRQSSASTHIIPTLQKKNAAQLT
jgi:hypothetical protein